jgi:hypothetical protein
MDALPRPNGPDDNHGTSLIIFQWSLAGIAAVVLGLRLFTAGAILRKVSIADYLMLSSFVRLPKTTFPIVDANMMEACAVIGGVLTTKSYQWGLGRHLYYLNDEQIIQTLKYATLQAGFTCASSAFARTSFCLFMLGFVTDNRFIQSCLWLSIFAQAIASLVFIVITYSACGTHIAAEWDYHVQAHCLGLEVLKHNTYFLFGRLITLFLSLH